MRDGGGTRWYRETTRNQYLPRHASERTLAPHCPLTRGWSRHAQIDRVQLVHSTSALRSRTHQRSTTASDGEIMSSSVASASSSPPTPPSPLPVSVGSGLQRYVFTPSPSPSPPFSPPGGSSSPLLRVVRSEPRLHYSALSMDAIAKEPCSRQRPTTRRFDIGAW
jgi:hypothetical protein